MKSFNLKVLLQNNFKFCKLHSLVFYEVVHAPRFSCSSNCFSCSLLCGCLCLLLFIPSFAYYNIWFELLSSKNFEPKYIWTSGLISLFAYSTTFLSLVFVKDIYGPWILTSSFDYRDEKLLEYILFSGAISVGASFLYYNSFKNLEPEKKIVYLYFLHLH